QLSQPLHNSPRAGSFAAANVESHERVDLRRLHHHGDLDLFVSGADAATARADLDRRYAELVVDVGIGPDAGAVRRLGFDLVAEKISVDFLRRLNQWFHVLAFVPQQRPVDVHFVIEAELLEHLLDLVFDRDWPYLWR